MTRAKRWTVGVLAAMALLLLVAGGLVAWWLPSETEIAERVQTAFEKRFGVAIKVGRVQWALRPVPVIVAEDIATVQAQPITVRRIALRPQLRALWDRRIALDEIEIDGAVLPRSSARAFRGSSDDPDAPLTGWTAAPVPVQRVRFTDVTWIDRRDIGLAYEGEIVFDEGWRPRTADIARVQVTPPARLRLVREGEEDRWQVRIDVGGGTWNGNAALAADVKAGFALRAELDPVGVDITQLVAAFQRKSAVQGKLSGRTVLEAKGSGPLAMVRSLHTRTTFNVKPATLLKFDLAKAVTTAGLEREGQTPLDELSGTLDTQATDDGILLRYTGLRARSGLLTATGSARVFNRKLDGEAAVDLVDGVVGVPFKLGGTLDAPVLSLTGGALTGAAIGSAVLPGVGTAIGARIGQKVEQMFMPDKKKKAEKRK
ncbi:MAG: hypothetical protein EOO26_10910 [Comamonadaceae bacterium]|nr:MAG: hypothetical protein EOO26_10910 [Comamonadaceae bacterium]